MTRPTVRVKVQPRARVKIATIPKFPAQVIAGNGIGALEIVRDLQREGRDVSHFFCPVSGGGLMAGQALAIAGTAWYCGTTPSRQPYRGSPSSTRPARTAPG